MGVRRAVEIGLDAANISRGNIYTYGPLIHNPQVLNLLKEKGITVVHDIPSGGSGTVIIRAHGVTPEIKRNFEKEGFEIIDATCPHVIKVQNIIRKHAKQEYASIIIGDKNHPEVIGLLGYSGDKGYVVGKISDINSLPVFDKAIVVAQTTQNRLLFREIKDWITTEIPHYKIFDTICDSTEKRQIEVNRLAKMVDVVIVVGGHSSGNTQRLADIAKQSGKPVYQIETEAELDAKALASVKSVGITAGASTPNWIIKRVYRALETLLSKKNQGLSGYIYTIQRILMLTNIYLSVGAGCLCYAWSALQGAKHFFPPMSVSMLYVYSIHIFNNLTGVGADVFNDPDRASFYTRNKAVLEILAGIAVVTGLITSYTIGSVPFVILLFMSIMGLLYNLNFLPKSFISCKYQRIRDIPGSKTVLISIAWGVVTAIIPVFYLQQKSTTSVAVLLFVLSICLVFVRTSFFDILDMQGDRIVGKETIAIILGEKRTVHLLKLVLLFIIAALFLASLFHFISSLGFALLICPLFLLMILLAYEHGYLLPSIKLEFYVETNFILLGIITFLWS